MNLKPLPVGIQTFRDIIEGGFLYVDKTEWIYDLIRYSKGVYFLARPRRFGKSLLISTLAEIFAGNRDLFQDLWLHQSPYQWTVHPVIRIDFSQGRINNVDDLERFLLWQYQQVAQTHQITLTRNNIDQQLQELIQKLAQQNPVVILIDEYDKPILDNIDNLAEAQQIRESLKSFYTTIKSMDAYLRFVFLTGISKFSKVGVFSGLNNLQDLSLNNKYATLLGITQSEIEDNFNPYLPDFCQQTGLDEAALLAKIKHWYNGFCFSSYCQPVYNPFSLLLLFRTYEFQYYWFESGTPTFLLKLLKQQQYDVLQLENLTLNSLGFSSYEIENLDIIPILFQTGYLTIKHYDDKRQLYTLYYPNYEVERAFLYHLLGMFSSIQAGLTSGHLWNLIDALQAKDMAAFFQAINIFFANIPYDIHIKQEKYYQTIFYLIFKLMGLEITAEARTSRGRIDAVVELSDAVFIFEFKWEKRATEALNQIQQRDYATRYSGQNKDLYLVGVEFGSEGIVDWVMRPPGDD